MKIQKYKALDLYNLSTIKKIFNYEGYTFEKKGYIIKGFLINNENRKQILNNLLGFSTDVDLTKKILNKETKYIVGLFDLNLKKIIQLNFGSNKEVLEKFNQLITSNKFKEYFEKNVSDLNLSFNNQIDNFKIDSIENIKENKFFELNDYKKIKNVEDFLSKLNTNDILTQDLIENEDKISEIISTIENELEKNPNEKLIKAILEIQYPFAHTLKYTAFSKLRDLKLKKESETSKKNRLAQLENV